MLHLLFVVLIDLVSAYDDYSVVLDVGSSHTSVVLYGLDWSNGLENAVPSQVHECYLVSLLKNM